MENKIKIELLMNIILILLEYASFFLDLFPGYIKSNVCFVSHVFYSFHYIYLLPIRYYNLFCLIQKCFLAVRSAFMKFQKHKYKSFKSLFFYHRKTNLKLILHFLVAFTSLVFIPNLQIQCGLQIN